MIINELFEAPQLCPECGGISFSNLILAEKKDACYYKVKASAKVWPSAYASGRLVQCRKKGAGNYGNKSEGVAKDDLNEFAPSANGGGDAGNYFKELASAWYNGTFDSGSLQKGIKSQQDVEQLLNRGIVGPDGATRKYAIDYNSDFDGVVISSDDYYEHSDYNEQGQEVDSRTGQTWGPYDYMEFGDEELGEDMSEGKKKKKSSRSQGYFFPGYGYYGSGDSGEGGGDGGGGESKNHGMAEGELDEKSTSQAQFRTMAAAAHNPEFARKVGIKQSVAKEFHGADRKQEYKKLPDRTTEGEQQKGADYRDPKEVDYNATGHDDMVARMKKLAGLGPLKTVYDPKKRVYKNVPVAVQPKP